MSIHERYKGFKGRLKDKARRLVGSSPAASTNSLPNNPPSNISPMPESLARPFLSIARTASTPPSGGQEAANHTWASLRGFLRVLAQGSTMFGPLRIVMEDLAQCIAMYEDAAAARRDYKTLRSELEALFGTLSMHFTSEAPFGMTASMHNLCSAIEKELDRISGKEDRGTARRHRKAKTDLDEMMECYRRIQGHLARLALNADLSTWKTVDEIATEARLSKLQPAMSACYDSAEAGQLRRRECTPKTREEVLAELGSWTHDWEQGNIYWLNGMAGTGKTTIATSLCAMLERTHEIGASFFCARQLPECREVKRILPTIAYQLACFSRPFRCALSRVLERDPSVNTKSLPIQLEGLIIGPLREVVQTLPKGLVVVIDALDECDDSSGVEQILEMLLSYASELPIKVFVSSRPEPQIRRKIGSTRPQLVLHELDDKIVKGDIEIYLRAELVGVSISESQLSEIVDRAGVLFIYAATVVRYVTAEDFHLGQQKRLDIVLGASSTTSSIKDKEIDTLYSVVLTSAFSNPELEDSDKERMRLVLWTVVCALEPLTVDALAALLQLGDGDWVRAALRPLWSVLHISGLNNLVNALHASFPDYMFSPQRSKEYTCDEEAHHGRMAELCFARIENNKCQFNICELESSYLFDKEVPNLDDRVKQAIPLDLEYACQCWAGHLKLGGPSGKRIHLLDEFLSKRLLLWMEVLNLLRRISLGPISLEITRTWCTSQDGEDTKDLVRDAWRFVTTFAVNLVSLSTPHIYVSMLAFWPSSRPVAERYIRRTNRLVNVTGTAMTRRELAMLGIIVTDAAVLSVSFSPLGTWIVSGSDDATIGMWDAQSGEMALWPLEGHSDSVNMVVFSSDGTRVVSGSKDNTIRVWDGQSGEMMLGPLEGHTGPVNSVAFSPDGMRIVSGSNDKTLRVWDGQSGQMALGPLEGHTGPVNSVAFSPNSMYIVSGSSDKTIRVWDGQNGQLVLGPLEGHTGSVNSVMLSPNGTRIVSGSSDKTIRVWDGQSGQIVLGPLEGHTGSVSSVVFSPDGMRIASGSSDDTIRVWDGQSGQIVLGPLKGHISSIYSVAFSPDGMRIVSGSWDNSIRVWDGQSTQTVPEPLEGHAKIINSVAFSSGGRHIVSGSSDNTIRVWDGQSGQMVLGPLQGHTDPVYSVAFSPDDTCIISGSADKTIRVWDVGSGEMTLGPLEGHTSVVSLVAFSPNGMRIVSSSWDETIRVWDGKSGQMMLGPLDGHTSWVNSVAFSPDGTRIVSGSSDNTILVWDGQSGQVVLGPLMGHTAPVCSVAFSPDGMRIVSGAEDDTIIVWGGRDGQMVLAPFKGHTEAVTSVAFSPDGIRIVSSSMDDTIRVWDVQTGQTVLGPFEGHTEMVNSVAFSSDGKRIVSGSNDQTIRVWDAQGGQMVPGSLEGHADTVPLVASVLNDTRIVASTPDHTTHVSGTSYSSTPMFPDHSETCIPDLSPSFKTLSRSRLDIAGWVVDEHQNVLLWVPHDLRDRLLVPPNLLLVSTQGFIQLSFENAKIGESWTECYTPA